MLVAAGGCELASADWWISGRMSRSWDQPQAIPSLPHEQYGTAWQSQRLAGGFPKEGQAAAMLHLGRQQCQLQLHLPGLAPSFGGDGNAEGPFPTLDQLHGFAELLTSRCAATWPQHVQHWHSPAPGLLLPPGAAKHEASLSAHELSEMWGRGSEGCGQTLLQKASDFLAERQWLLSLLTVSGNYACANRGWGCFSSRLGGRGQAAQMCAWKRGLSAEPRGAAGHLTPHCSHSTEK